MNEKQFIINESLVKGLLQYLVNRPYAEVVSGVQGLQNLQELKSENKEEIA